MLNKKRTQRACPPRLITVDLRTTQKRRKIGVGVFCCIALMALFFALNYGVAHLRFLTLEMRSETYKASALQMDNMRRIRELEQSKGVKLDSDTVREIATSKLGMQQITPQNTLEYTPSPEALAYANFNYSDKTSVKPYGSIVEDIANGVEISPLRKVIFSFIDAGKAFAAVSEINNERKGITEKMTHTPVPTPTDNADTTPINPNL